jgi:hypothetical protein
LAKGFGVQAVGLQDENATYLGGGGIHYQRIVVAVFAANGRTVISP